MGDGDKHTQHFICLKFHSSTQYSIIIHIIIYQLQGQHKTPWGTLGIVQHSVDNNDPQEEMVEPVRGCWLCSRLWYHEIGQSQTVGYNAQATALPHGI